jgi:biotin-(acetyl-CoA carboxylase) ligase
MTFNTIKITDTESTNILLKQMAAEGAEIGTTLVATRQSGG